MRHNRISLAVFAVQCSDALDFDGEPAEAFFLRRMDAPDDGEQVTAALAQVAADRPVLS
jgi:hypothetical protein